MTSPHSLRFAHRTTPHRPLRLATSVAEDLIDAIVSGRLPTGSLLPGEQTLCEDFSVSRVVVREALKSLEQRGLLVIRQGQGTVVAPANNWDPLDSKVTDARIRHDDTWSVLDNLVQVRVALECEMAAAAATRRTPEQVADLNQLLIAMEMARPDHDRYVALDLEFHDRVMQMSHNDVGRAVVTSIHSLARASGRYSGGVRDDQIARAHAGHVAIAQDLTAGDQDGVRAHMRDHILVSWLAKRALLQTGVMTRS